VIPVPFLKREILLKACFRRTGEVPTHTIFVSLFSRSFASDCDGVTVT
jgi:hypothetical protein